MFLVTKNYNNSSSATFEDTKLDFPSPPNDLTRLKSQGFNLFHFLLDDDGRFFACEDQWDDLCPWGWRHAFWWLWRPILGDRQGRQAVSHAWIFSSGVDLGFQHRFHQTSLCSSLMQSQLPQPLFPEGWFSAVAELCLAPTDCYTDHRLVRAKVSLSIKPSV